MISEWINTIGYALSRNKKYEDWSQRQYDKWGSKLKPLYKKIDKLKWSPGMKKVIESLAKALPQEIARQLLKNIIMLNEKFGKEEAENWLRNLLLVISKIKF